MTKAQLQFFLYEYNIPTDVQLRVTGPNESMDDPPFGKVAFYFLMFPFGVRLSLRFFLQSFFKPSSTNSCPNLTKWMGPPYWLLIDRLYLRDKSNSEYDLSARIYC